MTTPEDLRTSRRIPIENRVQVRTNARKVFNALAINLSMGGLLLSAAPPLPVGSACELSILLPNGHLGNKVLAKGTVIRSDERGTAIQFERAFDEKVCNTIISNQPIALGRPAFGGYFAYFVVSQSRNYAGCEKLLGVTKSIFKKVFISTFFASFPLSAAPVWMIRHDITSAPNWLKIVLAFVYALIWLAIIQPTADLLIFKYYRHKKNGLQKI